MVLLFIQGFCKCPDGSEVNARSDEMTKLMSLCPRGEMEGCKCHDDKFVKLPFNLQTFFFDCRPKEVIIKYSKQLQLQLQLNSGVVMQAFGSQALEDNLVAGKGMLDWCSISCVCTKIPADPPLATGPLEIEMGDFPYL